MALVPLFSVSQQVGLESVVILTDTSTGSDVNITERHVYLRKSDGLFLVPTGTVTDYIVWDYNDASIEIDCLDKDYALQITVEWVSTAGEILISSTDLLLINNSSDKLII